jgi:hypothetical protein
MVAFGWLLPESPRYLIEKGRLEDARESLLRLRRGKRGYTPDEDLAALEQAHEESISAHGQAKWSDCFRGSDLKRTLIVLGIQCLQQGQGIGFMSQYLVSVADSRAIGLAASHAREISVADAHALPQVVFFLQIGFTQVYLILVIVGALLVVLTSVGFFTQDFIGRRMLLMIGALFQGAALMSVGGITKAFPVLTDSQRNACVGLIFVWLIAFTQSWTNIPWTVSAELPSNRLRDKTLTIGAWGGYGVGLIITFVNPYMQDAQFGNLGGGVGFVYGAISFVSIAFVYFFMPELKGITLETVDAMFDAGIPPRKMGTHPMRFERAAHADNGEVQATGAHDVTAKEADEHDEKV